jgi:hypothetical protein
MLLTSHYIILAQSPLKFRQKYAVIQRKIKIYKTILLHVVLYGFETWSLTLKGEHRLRVFENKVLRIIFVPKREELAAGKLHYEELNNLCSSPSIVRITKSRMRHAGQVEHTDRVWAGEQERK